MIGPIGHWTQPANASIAIQSQTPGNFAANNFAGFTSPPTTVVAGSPKLLRTNPDDGSNLATSIAYVRDGELNCYPGGRGNMMLRMAGPSGNKSGIYMLHNNAVTGGDIRIGYITGFDEKAGWENQSGFTVYPIYVNTNVTASSEGITAGYNVNFTTGDHFTFGANGFQIYLQFNGHDLFRVTDWRVMQAGQMLIWSHPTFGSPQIDATYFTPQCLCSNPNARIYHPYDFGMRPIDAVTGSITGGTSSLVLSRAVGFQVGDQIIVEVGAESGLGTRQTQGVGGSWPTLKYANTTVMNADTSKPSGTWAADSSSGIVYLWDGASWTHHEDGTGLLNQGYYSAFIVPKALVAKVTNVSGATLTLDTNATVTATNANVWLDCYPSFLPFTQGSIFNDTMPVLQNITMNVPAGNWALSRNVVFWSQLNVPYRSNGVRFLGAGRTKTTLFAPKGCNGLSFNFQYSDNAIIQDFKFQSNHGPSQYGFRAGEDGSQGGATVPGGISIGPAAGGLVQNIDFIDMFSTSVELQQTSGATCQNCTLTQNFTQNAYCGWQFQSSNGSNNIWNNVVITAVALQKGFETFSGDSDQFIDCGGQNAVCSTNSSGGWTFTRWSSTLTTNCRPSTNPHGVDEQVMTISAHAFPGAGVLSKGGTITNPRIIQQGYIDSNFNVQKAIQIESTNPNITITGQYPEAGGHTTLAGGYFEAPAYNATSPEYGNLAIMIDATGCSVSGIRVNGGAAIGSPGHSSHYGNISTTLGGTSITGCVADIIHGGTQSGNQSNSGY